MDKELKGIFGEKKYRAYFVKTQDGKKGQALHNDRLVDGKVPVYLTDEQYKPLRDDQGGKMRALYALREIQVIGYLQ